MEKLTIGICIIVIFVVAYSAFIAFPVMLLWNWLMHRKLDELRQDFNGATK